jgi:hypothetical protein
VGVVEFVVGTRIGDELGMGAAAARLPGHLLAEAAGLQSSAAPIGIKIGMRALQARSWSRQQPG